MHRIKQNIVLISILVASVTGIGGAWAGLRLSDEQAMGKFAQWHSLGVPPNKAVRIARLTPSFGEKTVTVDVETATGRFFQYSKEHYKWIEVESPESERYMGVGSCEQIPAVALSSFSSKPLDCGTMIWSREWVRDNVHFVVLEDGSVWWWHEYVGFDTLVLFLCGGFIVGACFGLIFFAISRHLLQYARTYRS